MRRELTGANRGYDIATAYPRAENFCHRPRHQSRVTSVYARGEVNRKRTEYLRVFVRRKFAKIHRFWRKEWQEQAVGEGQK